MIYRSSVDVQLKLVNHSSRASLDASVFPAYRASLNLELLLINAVARSSIETQVLPIKVGRGALEAVMLDCVTVGFYSDVAHTQLLPNCEVLEGTGDSQTYVFLQEPAAVYHDGYKDLGVKKNGRVVQLSYPVKTGDCLIGVPSSAAITSNSAARQLYLNQAGLYVAAREPRYGLPTQAQVSADGVSWYEFALATQGSLQVRPRPPEDYTLYDEILEVVAVEVVNDIPGATWSVTNGQLSLEYVGTITFTDITGKLVQLEHSGGSVGGAYVTADLHVRTADGDLDFNVVATCLLVNKVSVTRTRRLGTLYAEIDLTPGVNPVVS